MHKFKRPSSPLSLKFFASRALLHPDDWEKRFNWDSQADDGSDGFTQAEMDAIYAEIIAKIPAGVTRVLDLGCGDGRFGALLKTLKPGVEYRGVDFVPENIEAARTNNPTLNFDMGNAWEYLTSADQDWDFIVSVGCLFSNTGEHDRMFKLLDSRSPRGFIVLVDSNLLSDDYVTEQMEGVAAASTRLAESYATGNRDFLLDPALKGLLRPLMVLRGQTSTRDLGLIPRLCLVEKGRANEILERTTIRVAMRQGGTPPRVFKGFVSTGGLVTGTDANLSVSAEKISRVPPQRARVAPDVRGV